MINIHKKSLFSLSVKIIIFFVVFPLIFLPFSSGYTINVLSANTPVPAYNNGEIWAQTNCTSLAVAWYGNNEYLDTASFKLKLADGWAGTTYRVHGVCTFSNGTFLSWSDNSYDLADFSSSYATYSFTFHNVDILLSSGLLYMYGVVTTTPSTETERFNIASKSDGAGGHYYFRTSASNGSWTEGSSHAWNIVYTREGTYEELTATPTPTPTPTPAPTPAVVDNVMPMIESIFLFFFGEGGTLSAGFGLLIMFACSIIAYVLAGKDTWAFFAGMNIGFIVNNLVGIWETWTIILLILIDLAIIIRGSGIMKQSSGEE